MSIRLAAVVCTLSAVVGAQTPIESLRTDLTYLASDELDGRGTPSHGLDLAADYIAKQFQQAGLKPAAPDGSYFQVAKFAELTRPDNDFSVTFQSGGKKLSIRKNEARVRSLAALDLRDERVVKLPVNGPIPPVSGLVVAGDASRYGDEGLFEQLQAGKPALILLTGKGMQQESPVEEIGPLLAPVIRIGGAEAAEFLNRADVTLSLHLSPSKQALLRNVAGILPGSDPALRDQYIVLTAHYDHLGHDARGIFHGANDNGSGTVSVIEIARELAALKNRPRRGILFIAFFGEEEGLLGSYYYTHHPLVPLKNTIASVNLEQLGRTDDTTGTRAASFAFTGPSYSTLPAIMTEAAESEGVKVYRRRDADAFFDRSDNYPFARKDIVDTTIVVAFEYPEYHAVGDTVDKIDFANMAKVDRAIAAGVERLADEPAVPRWTGKPHP